MTMTETEWLEARRSHITASDIAGILGVSRYATPRSVWEEKLGLAKPRDTEAMQIGRAMEPIIADLYSNKYSVSLEKATFVVSESDPLFAATPDYYCGDDGIVEIKCTSGSGFGADGTSDVPEHYRLQVCWQMHVTGRRSAHIAALIATRLQRHPVAYDESEMQLVASTVRDWWNAYVVTKTPPPPAAGDDKRVLESAEMTGAVISASDELECVIAELAEVRDAYDKYDKRKSELEAMIKVSMADAGASVLESSAGRFTLRQQSRKSLKADRVAKLLTQEQLESCYEAGSYWILSNPWGKKNGK